MDTTCNATVVWFRGVMMMVATGTNWLISRSKGASGGTTKCGKSHSVLVSSATLRCGKHCNVHVGSSLLLPTREEEFVDK